MFGVMFPFMRWILTPAVGVLLLFLAATLAGAQDGRLAPLFDALAQAPDAASAQAIERKIETEWRKSGSASMDYLLRRGQMQIEADKPRTALPHLTALTDHAPGFAEGWYAKAVAHFALGQYGPALDALEHTLALEPRHYNAMAGLMLILMETGFEPDALRVARMIQTIHPHFEDISTHITQLEAETKGLTL